MKLGGGDVEGEGDLVARRVARPFDRLDQQLEGRLVVGKVGGKPALVADIGGQALVAQDSLQRVVDLDPGAQRLRVGRQTSGDDHELLDVDRVGGVGAAIEHVETGDGQYLGRRAPEISVEGQPHRCRRRPCHGQGDGERRIGA